MKQEFPCYAGFNGLVFVVEDDLDGAQHTGLVDQRRNKFDLPLLDTSLLVSVELQFYLLADLEVFRLVGDDVGGKAARAHVGNLQHRGKRLDALALVLGDGDDLAVKRRYQVLLFELGLREAVFQGVLALVDLGRFPFRLGYIVAELLFPDLLLAHGGACLEKLLDGLVVLFVGVHLRLGGGDFGNVFRGNLGNADTQLVFGFHEVDERVALAHHVAFLDPDAVDFPGNGKADFCLLDGLRDAVKPAGRREGGPRGYEKCRCNVVAHGALVFYGDFVIIIFFVVFFRGRRLRDNQLRADHEPVHVRAVVGVDGDVHAYRIAAVPVHEDAFEHLDEQSVLVDPGVGVGVVAVAVDGAVDAAGVVPLDTVGILGQGLGELDPDGVRYAERRLEILVAGPGVAGDRVNALARLEGGGAAEFHVEPFAGILAVGDNLYRDCGCGREGFVMVQEEGVLADPRDYRNGNGIGLDRDRKVVRLEVFVENVVRGRKLRHVLETDPVGVHHVGLFDERCCADEGIAGKVDAPEVCRGCGLEAGEVDILGNVAQVLVRYGLDSEDESRIGRELCKVKFA